MESDESNDTSSESGNEDDSSKPQKFSRSKRSTSRESTVSSKSSSRSRSPSSSSESEKSVENVPPVEKPETPKSLTNGNCDLSPKSVSSKASSKSKISQDDSDDESVASDDSRDRRKSANLDDGNTSDSSESSADSSSRGNTKPKVTDDDQVEKVSDTESVKNKLSPKSVDVPGNINIAHEDLSDVSDLEDSIDQSDNEELTRLKENAEIKEVYQSRDKKSDDNDGEEQLDFEAEDGECAETDASKDITDPKNEHDRGEIDDDADAKRKAQEELEEGEITDEDDVRPEETEPRPVCRFFSRGQCTWGASCRFLHPGVTDKGNYTMFDIVRPVVAGDYVSERLPYAGRAEPPPLESAWERGLRTAKEMMRKSIKRKEQDIDFEEKKLNLSIAQEELDKENGYYAKAPTPEPSRYVTIRHAPLEEYPPIRLPPQEYYGRRPIAYEPAEYIPPPRERIRYREVPPHRSADYYSSKHDDESSITTSSSKKNTLANPRPTEEFISNPRKPKREVIVQRHEERSTRGDEWSDPWMRSKSPVSRKGAPPRKRSYSSGSSYTSSSSSATSRSSYRSRSRSRHKRSPRRPRRQVSPSVIVSERKAANERAALMNPPAPRKKAPSPGMMRVGAQNPPAPVKVDQFGRTRSKLAVAAALARVKGRSKSSRSSSASSSGSSSSDSESSGSSSSSSRNGSPSPRRSSGPGVDLAMALKAKAIDALKSGSEKRQIKLNLKNAAGPKKSDLVEVVRKADASRKRLANSPPASEPTKAISNKKASSRREELLKQLKAVEDAIAKKRSKV